MGASTRARVVIVDYGTGNLHSVRRSLERIGVEAVASACASDIENADKIILPGVGHFGSVMSALETLGLRDALNMAVLVRRTPILGICLGLELMARHSDEGDVCGLDWLDADSIRFEHADTEHYKTPHIGWNQVSINCRSRLMSNVGNHAEFYFAHSYYLNINERSCLVGETEYDVRFPSVVERGNVFGVQFHPEKSHDAGRRVLENFARM